jgi:hypothetical protein
VFLISSIIICCSVLFFRVMYDQKSSGVLTSGPSTVAAKFSDAEIEKWNKDIKAKIDKQEKEQKKRLHAETAVIDDVKK